jgi:hypothetical protein
MPRGLLSYSVTHTHTHTHIYIYIYIYGGTTLQLIAEYYSVHPIPLYRASNAQTGTRPDHGFWPGASHPRPPRPTPGTAARRTQRASARGGAGARSGHLQRASPAPPTFFLGAKGHRDGVDAAIMAQELPVFYSGEPTNLLENSGESSHQRGAHRRGLEHRIRPQIWTSTASKFFFCYHHSVPTHRPSKITACTPSTELASLLLRPLVPPSTRNCRFEQWDPNHGRNWFQYDRRKGLRNC